jgi:hypothetical protein
MLVFTRQQRDFFLEFKKGFQSILYSREVDLVPIEIKNDLWILGEEVLGDKRYSELKQELIDGGHLQKVEIREVTSDEFIIPDVN